MSVAIPIGKIPVYGGDHLIEHCDAARARWLGQGANVELTTARKTGEILRVTIRPMSDGREHDGASENSLVLTYDEVYDGRSVTVLKRWDTETGRFVHWSDRDGFNARRFNPDLLPKPRGR